MGKIGAHRGARLGGMRAKGKQEKSRRQKNAQRQGANHASHSAAPAAVIPIHQRGIDAGTLRGFVRAKLLLPFPAAAPAPMFAT
jgi:hypothetical protein